MSGDGSPAERVPELADKRFEQQDQSKVKQHMHVIGHQMPFLNRRPFLKPSLLSTLHKLRRNPRYSILRRHLGTKPNGFVKGKSAIPLARLYGARKRNFIG